MLERLEANFRSVGVEPPPVTCCTWHELPSPFPAGHFDVLLCIGNSISHLPPTRDGVETALRNFLALLKPGGLCFIDTKKYNSRFEELNFNKDRTNLEVRWYRADDHPAPPGGGKPRRFHYMSEYDLDAEHRYTLQVLEEDSDEQLHRSLGTFEFWPVSASYLAGCLKNLRCPSVLLKDMRLTKHKYDLLVGRKNDAERHL
jgi:SAM-dependent methyltransferase